MNSLPERPNLDHLRKQAKDLLRQSRAHDPAALASFRQHLPAAKDKSDAELSTLQLGLRDAQSCIARQYGFPSWEQLKQYVERKSNDAQTSTVTVGSADAEAVQRRYEIAQRGYEQARPRTAVPFDPENFDRYVGYYRLSHAPTTFTHIFRDGERFFEQLNIEKRAGVTPVEFYPESEAQRINNNTASRGTEAFLCRYITGCEKGQPNYDEMSPPLARAVRRLQPIIEKRHERVGVFKALSFKGIDRRGWDVYEATFTQGQVEYRTVPFAADGKATDIAPREVP